MINRIIPSNPTIIRDALRMHVLSAACGAEEQPGIGQRHQLGVRPPDFHPIGPRHHLRQRVGSVALVGHRSPAIVAGTPEFISLVRVVLERGELEHPRSVAAAA